MVWKFTDAKEKLEEVVDLVIGEGPQKIQSDRGVVVLVSEEEYLRLSNLKSSFRLNRYRMSLSFLNRTKSLNTSS